MASKGTPLCSTCSYHETQSGRINFMWGAGWVFSLVIGPITVGIILALIFGNKNAIQDTRDTVRKHEVSVQSSMHEIEQTLSVMSINQKRQMEEAGVKYIEPEQVRHSQIEDWK